MSGFRNHRFEGVAFGDVGLFEGATINELFGLLGAQEFIDAYRFPKYGPLDMGAVATSLGAELQLNAEASGSLGLYEHEIRKIQVADQRKGRGMVTFAHEVGHLFMHDRFPAEEREHNDTSIGWLEGFCDYFAYRMVFNGIDFKRLDIANAHEIHETGELAGADVIEAMKAWLIFNGSPSALEILTRWGDDMNNPALRREEKTCYDCRCNIFSSLDCPDGREPLTVDYRDFELAAHFPSFRSSKHMTQQERDAREQLLSWRANERRMAAFQELENPDEPF